MGIFMALFLSSLAPILISIAMLDRNVFKKSAGWIGMIGMAFLVTQTIGTTFIPNIGDSIMVVIAMLGSQLMID